jgi:biopolymer transport protein ExbD
MAFAPTAKRDRSGDEPDLNLNPMMDMFGVLIPAILMMSAGVQVAVVSVLAPTQTPPTPTKSPLEIVTLSITDVGYVVEAERARNGSVDRWRIPVVERSIGCGRYRDTRPPPRSQNSDRPPCGSRDRRGERNFIVYDNAALTARAVEIKDGVEAEHGLIVIRTDPTVEYEAIVDAMDAVREVRRPDGTLRTLFDQVLLGPPSP